MVESTLKDERPFFCLAYTKVFGVADDGLLLRAMAQGFDLSFGMVTHHNVYEATR